jgi:putative transposase
MALSRSTYYYRSKARQTKAEEDAKIRDRMERLALRFPGYGYRRFTEQFQRDGFRVNHKRVLRIARESGLLARPRQRFVVTTNSDHSMPVFPNLLRAITPTRINQVWVSDITYIRVRTGFAFLAAILDAFSRKVVGWALSLSITSDLVCAALETAWKSRRPKPGLIFHSDRGTQYCSEKTVALARDTHRMQISMSRTGNPYDNAIAESFFKTLKYEEIYLSEVLTFEELGRRLPEYIDRIYNTERLHSALGYLPPAEFEAQVCRA